MKRAISLLVFFVSFVGSFPCPAMETDQFNLSPTPLADIAPEVEAYVAERIQAAIDKLNDEIAKHERCLANRSSGSRASLPGTVDAPSTVTNAARDIAASGDVGKDARAPVKCASPDRERANLANFRSPGAVAKAVYEQLGSGSVFITTTGKWLNTHKFEHEPSRYKAPFTESIYWERPINYATLSPTIRMYDVEFGTDKLDHMFQQGYTYYRKYTAALKAGKSEADAIKAAVSWGRSTENLFYGYVVSGVYSNADLAANMAGLKFYLSLTGDLKVGEREIPKVLVDFGGRWIPASSENIGTRPHYLAGLISDHLNEAYNPSNYLPLLYPIVKRAVKKNACSDWRATFPMLTAAQLTSRTAALTKWNGLDYGYKQTSRQVLLGEVCFEKSDPLGQ